MARRQANDLARDPNRLGQTGGRPRGGPGVTRLIGKALGQRWQRARRPSQPARGFKQRVVVKVLVVKRGPRQGGGKATRGGASLARHVRYLGRDGTSEQGERGQFYDRAQEALDAAELTKPWHDDRHHFRLIVSPEKGGELTDLTAYVREVMARVERDQCPSPGERLEWMAINHFNTDNPHAHVLVRGVRERVAERSAEADAGADERPKTTAGRMLVMPRVYVSHGLRGRAEEVATEILGERSLEEVRRSREQEVTAERWTGLDRSIVRQADRQRGGEEAAGDLRIDVAPKRLDGVSPHERGLIVRRLQTLDRYGLARPSRGSAWEVAADFRERLLALAARQDVIQQLYGKHGLEAAARVVPYGLAERPAGRVPEPLAGRVVDHGAVDEMTLDRFVVIEDARGVRHYAKVVEGPAYERVRVGASVEIGRTAYDRATAATAIADVAAADPQRFFSRDRHAASLADRVELSDGDRAALVERAARHADALARRSNNAAERPVEQVGGGAYRVDVEAVRRSAGREARRATTDLRVIAGGRSPERTAERVPGATPRRRGRDRDDRGEAEQE